MFISGLHYGHYKSAAESKFMSEINTLFSHIATKTGHPLPRWPQVLQMMILKERKKLKIDKFLEANYNWISKLLFNKRLIHNAEELVLIPDKEFRSSKDRRSTDAAVCRKLFWDRHPQPLKVAPRDFDVIGIFLITIFGHRGRYS